MHSQAVLVSCVFCFLVASSLCAPQWPGVGSTGYGFAPWGGYGNYASSSSSAAASSSSGGYQNYGLPGFGYGLPGYGYGNYGNYQGGYQQQYNQFAYNRYNNGYGFGQGSGYPFGYGK